MLSITKFNNTLALNLCTLGATRVIDNLYTLTKIYHVLTTHIDVHAKTCPKVFNTAYTKSVEFMEDLANRTPNNDIVKCMLALREYQRVYNLSPMFKTSPVMVVPPITSSRQLRPRPTPQPVRYVPNTNYDQHYQDPKYTRSKYMRGWHTENERTFGG